MNGKTVVVIGAGSGIGRAVVVDAANAGATLILGGRTAAPLKETARLAGGTVRVVDASREEDVRAFFELIGSMRRQIFAVMTFLIAITLDAADSPLTGTWRLTG